MKSGLIKVLAPGKLILAGEHAVACGAPALVLALDYGVETQLEQEPHPGIGFEFEFCNFKKTRRGTFDELSELKTQIDDRYQQFKNKQLPIAAVLTQPTDLALYTLAHFCSLQPLDLQSLKITLNSNIPMGCGLGSSAATIVSIWTALKALQPMSHFRPELPELVNIESLQHGLSSGVDLSVSILGGIHYFQAGLSTPRKFPRFPLYFVNTGPRDSGSGAAISKVAAAWQHNHLLPAFVQVVENIDRALRQQDFASFYAAILENHHLLCELGIVPIQIQTFIQTLAQQGFAAKISGAGAVSGDQAGMVIITGTGDPALICQDFGYTVTKIAGEVPGAGIL